MKYKISLYGSGYRVNAHRMPKNVFKDLKFEYENANRKTTIGVSRLEKGFKKILDIESIWDIFWNSGQPGTYVDGEDFLGLNSIFIAVEDLQNNKVILEDKEIDLNKFINSSDLLDRNLIIKKEKVLPFLFFACESLKGICWVCEFDSDGEFDINKLLPIVQEYPQGLYLVVGLSYNSIKLNLEDAHELDGSGNKDYYFSNTPFYEKLELNGLTSLSNNAAQAFSKHKGTLCLNGLTLLSDNSAEYLSNHIGILELKGLNSISDKAAESLSRHKGKLYLGDLKEISEEARNFIAKHELDPKLSVTIFSNDEIDISANENRTIANLDHLIFLSEQEAMNCTVLNDTVLSLNGLRELSETAAGFLYQFEGSTIELNGLMELSDKAAEALGRFRGDISLNSLSNLSDRAAKALSNGMLIEQTQDAIMTKEAVGNMEEQKEVPNLNRFSSSKSTDLNAVQIGRQVWMTQNLDADHFRNGDSIPEAKTKEEWKKAGINCQPAWCYYSDDPVDDGRNDGKLYNWYAVNDPRGLAPEGWHIPDLSDWTQLREFLGGEENAGFELKSNNGWYKEGNGSNSSGFSGLPRGMRDSYGNLMAGLVKGTWWSTTKSDSDQVWDATLSSYDDNLTLSEYGVKKYGYSVRCVKD